MNCGTGPDGLLARGRAGRAADRAAAGGAAQRRHPQGSREPPHLFLLARISDRIRQALRGPGRGGRGRLLRHHARAHPRGGPGRQAAGPRPRARPPCSQGGRGPAEAAAAVGREIAAGGAAGRRASGSPPSSCCRRAATICPARSPRAERCTSTASTRSTFPTARGPVRASRR